MKDHRWLRGPLAVLPSLLVMAGCGSGNGTVAIDAGTGGNTGGGGGGGAVGGGGSPGAVMVKLEITSATTYCQQAECGPASSITIKDSTGKVVVRSLGIGACSASCDTCLARACPGFACQPQGYAVTGESLTWDGSYFASATCGAGMQCDAHLFVKPGAYTAVICATPGTLAGDANGVATCTATASVKCVEVPFQFPSSQPVVGTL